MVKSFAGSYTALVQFLSNFTHSWHFKMFLGNFLVLLVLSLLTFWIVPDKLPNSSDSILYIVHAHALKESILGYLLLPSIDMQQYAGIPILGVGPLVPFIPLAIVALFTGEVFAYKILSLIVLAAAGGTMSYYTYSLIHSRLASFIAAVIYVWNPPMFITAIIEGHFDLTWSYMLIPLLFLTTSRALNRTSPVNLGIAGATFGLMLFGHAQMLLLVGPFYFAYVLVLGVVLPSLETSREPKIILAAITKKLGGLGVIVLVGFLLSAIRLLPLIYETPYRYSDVSPVYDLQELMAFSPPSVFHALALFPLGFGSLSTDYLAATLALLAVFALVPIFATVAFALDYHKRLTVVSFILGLLAAFITAGPAAPQFFQPFVWLFQYVPFFDQIRTPGRYGIVVAFFWAFLCGVAIKKISEHISARFSKTPGLSKRQQRTRARKKIKTAKVRKEGGDMRDRTAVFLFIILMLGTAPLMNAFLTTYDFSPQLAGAYETIKQQPGDSRFIGFPIGTYYPKPVYGISTNPDCYAPILTGKANLFGDGSGASKELVDFLYYYLNSIVGSGVSYSIGKLLGLFNVKWIVLHRPMMSNDSVASLLADPTLRVIYTSPDSSEVVLETVEAPYPLVYGARSILLLGGPESLLALVGLDQFKLDSSARWAFIPAYQLGSSELTESFISKLDAVSLREGNLTSIFALEHGTSVDQLLSSSGVVNNGWEKRIFGDSYGRWIPQNFTGFGEDLDKSSGAIFGSYIATAGNAELSFNINIDNSGEYEFWIRRWFSNSDTGNLSLTIDKSTPSEHAMTIQNDAWQFGWQWLQCGIFNLNPGLHSLTMRNVGGASSVNSLMVVPKDALTTYTDYFMNLLETYDVNSIYVSDAHTSLRSTNHSWTPSFAWRGNTSTGRCLSTSIDGAKAAAEILAIVSGNYSIAIRLLQREQRGNITLHLDGVKLLDFKPQGEDKWVTRLVNASIFISRGYHNLTITNIGGSGNDVDKLILAHTLNETNLTSFFSEEPSGTVYDFRQSGPGVYTASIELSEPSVIGFNAAFHPEWRAVEGNSEYIPMPVNYLVNGFYINSTGRLTLTIVFGLTLPRVAGLCTTCIGLFGVAIMIVYGKYALKKSDREHSSAV